MAALCGNFLLACPPEQRRVRTAVRCLDGISYGVENDDGEDKSQELEPEVAREESDY